MNDHPRTLRALNGLTLLAALMALGHLAVLLGQTFPHAVNLLTSMNAPLNLVQRTVIVAVMAIPTTVWLGLCALAAVALVVQAFAGRRPAWLRVLTTLTIVAVLLTTHTLLTDAVATALQVVSEALQEP
ncbi:hypothetical protein [Deinococcus maricopensis]|uniref:Uncharacterized protein n=1 Tax=Deinococcus maricopensis (strain DSM 21211 / LMG 22137 / NRRL B-23946 / LB-34) TaxID=709986 RepID=E8U5H8_DEIML|nr:hypothetical protein [Deinococcus maricopensis]ADV66317.1 hypothetical protein Deima_0660 [Deinococcus maricopensis DSM 21211]